MYRDYYLRYRHPWWLGLCEYSELLNSGKAIYKNLTPSIEILAGDAKKILELQKFMPEKIINNYRGNLLVDERANDFLFELDIAWHYYINGNRIIWKESDQPQHEFTVVNNKLSFNVECKRISVDSFRKIKRDDFYRLVEILLPGIKSRNMAGTIELILHNKLEKSESFNNNIISFVFDTIDQGCTLGEFNNDVCRIKIELIPSSNKEVNLEQEYMHLWQNKRPDEHGVIFAGSYNSKPVDPVYLLCRCDKPDDVLKGISDKLKSASKNQLDFTSPGIISVFVEDIDDFSELAIESGLQIMTNMFLDSEKRNHIAAVIYSSNSRYRPDANIKTFFSQGLIFKNQNCKYEEAKKFNYLSKLSV